MGENTYQTPMNEQLKRAKEALDEERAEERDEEEEREIPLMELEQETSKMKTGSNKNQFMLGGRYQITDFSQLHEAILNFILTNPGKGYMSKCARAFGVSNSWLSTLVHSDLFQARLRDRNDEFYEMQIQPLQERMVGMAHATLDRLDTMLDDIEDPKVLIDMEDKLLHRLGYAPKTTVAANPAGQTNTQNNYYVTSDLLAQARKNAEKGTGPNEPKLIQADSEASSRVQDNEGGSLG